MGRMLEMLEQFLLQELELYGDSLLPRATLNDVSDTKSDIQEAEPWQGAETLEELHQAIRSCTKCSLSKLRHQFVFGEGDPNARIMLIGEAPGEDEDRLGRPFVGEAGELFKQNACRHQAAAQ